MSRSNVRAAESARNENETVLSTTTCLVSRAVRTTTMFEAGFYSSPIPRNGGGRASHDAFPEAGDLLMSSPTWKEDIEPNDTAEEIETLAEQRFSLEVE